MIIYAVYVISIDGRPIVSEKFQSSDSIPNEVLLGGLFTALQGVANEMTQSESELKSVEIQGLSYHFKSFGYYRIVLVTDLAQTPENIIRTLGLRFMKEHGNVVVDDLPSINVKEFEQFKSTIKEVVSEDSATDESKLINPIKKFNTGELFKLPELLKPTALAMIALKEGTIEDIAGESNSSKEETIESLTSLQEMGLIGRKSTNGTITFFCSF